jgi:3-oxoacyl-[acyl-carrier-protein] synthase-3
VKPYSRIIGTGGYLPPQVRTNDDIARMVDTSDDWIVERTGIRERRIAGDGESVASLAEVASRRAFEAADVDPQTLDLIVLGTSSPDRTFPSTACLLQQRLGARGCGAFDVQAACSGFIYALSVADQFIRAGSAKRILVVGSEINSRAVDWNDRGTCILFGDGAGAVVLEASEEAGVLSTHIHADGYYQDLLYLPSAVSKLNGERCHIHMHGNEVFKVAVNTLARSSTRPWRRTAWPNRTSTGWCRTRPISASSTLPPRSWACPWIGWCSPSKIRAIPQPPRCRWRSMRRFATAASSPVNWC